ncbi:hypothetical protein FGO68_gene138 [Halteria grandinella]|uniref:Uncharacterized protein n=1 Tax=Halteria grandinella TaxID=5974 RepID=A0A8J8NMN6_HALGN|nr:hypothetical protein FGO68_gene138 [Halteria grandinella]
MLAKGNTVSRYLEYLSDQHKMPQNIIQTQIRDTFNLDFIPLEDLSYSSCISHLQQKEGFEFIASEVGINMLGEYFTEQAEQSIVPMDSFVISSLYGDIVDPSLVGPPFPDIPIICKNFKMIVKSVPFELNTPKVRGQCVLTLWVKKSQKELIKQREYEAITTREEFNLLMKKEQDEASQKLQRKNAKSTGDSPVGGKSPHFERERYPWLSNREFQTKKPKD